MSSVSRSLGTNLAGITQWSTQSPFIDHFKSARSWIPQTSDIWDTQEGSRLDLDANGWVRSLPAAGSGVTYDRVSTMVLPFGEATRPGRYVVMYDGQGEISYGLGGMKVTTESALGRDVVQLHNVANLADQYPLVVQITATNPNDYIRNIRVYHEEDLPLVELGLRYNPEFLKNIGDFGTLRYMDWMHTNDVPAGNWQQRPTTEQATWANKGVPVEVMVDLANTTGSNPWFTIPHTASDDYVRQFATYVRDHLDPNLTANVEFSNEVWNFIFSQTGWAYEQGMANLTDANGNPVSAPHMQWYGVRAAQVADIWREVFAQRNDSPTLTTIFSTQSAYHALASVALEAPDWVAKGHRAPKESFDAYAIAPYFGSELGDPVFQETILSWARSGEAGMVAAFEQLRNGKLLVNPNNPYDPEHLGRSLVAIQKEVAAHKTIADQYGMELIAYEGGQHIVGVGGVQGNSEITEFFQRLNRDPRMGELYTEYFDSWKQSGGGLFANFSDVFLSGQWGSWGAKESWNQGSTPKYDALMNFIDTNDRWWADGSNGQKVGEFTRGQAGQESLVGSAFNDTLLGGAGNDTVTGGTGYDYLHGEAGDDRLDGSTGDDVLMGGLGRDTLIGGTGNDQFRFGSIGQGTDVITDFNRRSGEKDQITLVASGFAGLQTGALKATQYGEGRTVASASMAAFAANGVKAGAAILAVNRGTMVDVYFDANTSTQGNEQLLVTLNNRTISNISQAQFLVVSGNEPETSHGTDAATKVTTTSTTALNLQGSVAGDLLRGQDGSDTLNGGDGSDLLHGSGGNDRILGGNGDDRLFGGIGNDSLQGDAGDDSLSGGEGNDSLLGGDGIDRLEGFAGDDLLQGGLGKDVLTGGSGNDKFVFTSPTEFGDVITDLGANGDYDQIVLKGSSFSGLSAGNLNTNQFGEAQKGWEPDWYWLEQASQNARAANGGTGGAAVLALQNLYGMSVDLYYDSDTNVSGNEVFLATLSTQSINTLSANNFLVSR
jgi:Ca2+-binding RTX toxin-like protein